MMPAAFPENPGGPPTAQIGRDDVAWVRDAHTSDRGAPPGRTPAGGADPVWGWDRAAGFADWLMAQGGRDHEIGRLARDAALDPRWPAEATDVEELLGYLDAVGATGPARRALRRAWREFEAELERRAAWHAAGAGRRWRGEGSRLVEIV